MGNRRNISGIFRIIAGGYLIYLGIRLFRDGVLTGEMTGSHKVLGILFSIVFIVFGISFAVHAVRWMAKNSSQEEETEETVNEETEVIAEEEPVSSTPSLFERAIRTAGTEEEEDPEEEDPDMPFEEEASEGNEKETEI